MTRLPIKRTLLGATLLTLAMLYPSGSSGSDVLRWVRPGSAPIETAAAAIAETPAPMPASIEPAVPEIAADKLRAAVAEAPMAALANDTAKARAVPARMEETEAAAFDLWFVQANAVPVDPATEIVASLDAEPTALPVPSGFEPPYRHPWKDEDAIFVLDAYEFNELDWEELAKDERIRGFISKASDGMPEVYDCRNGGLQNSSPRHCKTRWRKYSVTKELYKTRRAMAKALGWKWGAYHMGRPGNPEAQADHFIDFADPQPDEFIAIDLEDNDPEKWMSLEETERFARRVHQRIGRWPALYTNGSTAKTIAQRKDEFPILSRLPLWYARFRPEIEGVFPMGHWDSYHTWQFLAQINCKRSCAMRPKGTNRDIDVNVVNATEETLDAMWATKDLLPLRGEQSVPTLMVDAEPTETAQPSYATAYADDEGTSTRVKAVFDEVLKVEDSVKAKLALDTPVPTMRPL